MSPTEPLFIRTQTSTPAARFTPPMKQEPLFVQTIRGIPAAATNLFKSSVQKTGQGLGIIGGVLNDMTERSASPEVTFRGQTLPRIDPTGMIGAVRKVGGEAAKIFKGSARKADTSVPFDGETQFGKDVEFTRVPLTDLKSAFSTNRDISIKKVDAIAADIEKTGKVKPLFADELSTVDGHHRLLALQKLGIEEVPVYKYRGDLGKMDATERKTMANVYLADKTKVSISPSLPKELEPLAKEARKYASAEEFVKAQSPIYRGSESTPVREKGMTPGYSGDAFTRDRSVASQYGENVLVKYIPESSILKASDVPPEVLKKLRAEARAIVAADDANPLPTEALISDVMEIAKQNGKAAADLPSFFRGMLPEREVRVLEHMKSTYTKSQLTDFYNKVINRQR